MREQAVGCAAETAVHVAPTDPTATVRPVAVATGVTSRSQGGQHICAVASRSQRGKHTCADGPALILTLSQQTLSQLSAGVQSAVAAPPRSHLLSSHLLSRAAAEDPGACTLAGGTAPKKRKRGSEDQPPSAQQQVPYESYNDSLPPPQPEHAALGRAGSQRATPPHPANTPHQTLLHSVDQPHDPSVPQQNARTPKRRAPVSPQWEGTLQSGPSKARRHEGKHTALQRDAIPQTGCLSVAQDPETSRTAHEDADVGQDVDVGRIAARQQGRQQERQSEQRGTRQQVC